MSRVLEGKIAVITGASSGIGRAISERYLAAGARIVVFARDLEGWRRSVPPHRRLFSPLPATSQKQPTCRGWWRIPRSFGNVDIVVPNAGMAKVVSFADSTEEAIHEQFSVNFVGAVQTARLFLPQSIRVVRSCSTPAS